MTLRPSGRLELGRWAEVPRTLPAVLRSYLHVRMHRAEAAELLVKCSVMMLRFSRRTRLDYTDACSRFYTYVLAFNPQYQSGFDADPENIPLSSRLGPIAPSSSVWGSLTTVGKGSSKLAEMKSRPEGFYSSLFQRNLATSPFPARQLSFCPVSLAYWPGYR